MQKNKVVSVITITKNRDNELIKCIESVKKQDYIGRIEHIIVGDSSTPLRRREDEIKSNYPNVTIYHIDLEKYTNDFIKCYIPSRIGFMRNWAIGMASGDYICQLDDDNTYDHNHVSSLVEVMESDPTIDIAFSWRKLIYEDGYPYLKEEYPWTPQARLAVNKNILSRYIYDELVKAKIRTPDTNIVRDSLITSNGEPVYTVDTSELMVRKKVHSKFLFTVWFSWRQMVGDYSDDYAFVKKCYEAGIKFQCSKKVTLNYTIGGISNK